MPTDPPAAAADPSPNDSPVDPAVLDELLDRLGDRGGELRASLIDAWLADVEPRRQELLAAAGDGSPDRVAAAAHALRSGSAALGALPLAARCERVELALRAGDPLDLPAEAAAIVGETYRAADGLAGLRTAG